MAFRRNYRRSPARRFARRRGGLNWRKVDPPTRWQVGNFNIQQFITQDDADQNFVSQLVATPANFLPNDTGDRRQITQGIRRIEVGGLVFSQGFDIIQNDAVSPVGHASLQQLWTVNQLDSSQLPVGVDYPWGSTSQPVSNQPTVLQENTDEPIRILDRWATTYSNADVSSGAGGTLPTFRERRMRFIRLKAPIDDKKVLLWTFHCTPNVSFGSAAVVLLAWCTGTIYYRYRW